MYLPGTVLSVQKFLYKHVGVYIGNGLVLHNHSQRGEEAVPIHRFSEGQQVSQEEAGVADPAAFMQRVQSVLANPQRYDFWQYNCDHTVSKVRTGVASSPQLAGLGFLALLVGGTYLLAKAK